MRATPFSLTIILTITAVSIPLAAGNAYCTSPCTYEPIVFGTPYKFDFSPLCTDDDRFVDDDSNHTYKFRVCGETSSRCLPDGWENTFEYGVTTQFWGDTPVCNQTDPQCTDKATGTPVCCSSYCQVLGVGGPHFDLIDPSNPNGGVRATYAGAPPSPDDPFWCPWNPQTGSQFPRTITYNFICDPSTQFGDAVVSQNQTNDCAYAITVHTSLACATDPTPTPTPTPTPPPPSSSPVCWPPADCTTCVACCKSYLPDAPSCSACALSMCSIPNSCTPNPETHKCEGACASCCASYLAMDADCLACMEEECSADAVQVVAVNE